MTELEKIAYAKSFIDKLANGINPLDDKPIPEGDIANNVRLSRCFFYVSDVLRQVIENEGVGANRDRRPRKQEFNLNAAQRARLLVSSYPITVSEIANNLNKFVNTETTKRITASAINDWLMSMGLLENIILSNGKKRKGPTDRGNQMGIFVDERNGQFGQYYAIIFTSEAQHFIYDNLDAIIAYKA